MFSLLGHPMCFAALLAVPFLFTADGAPGAPWLRSAINGLHVMKLRKKTMWLPGDSVVPGHDKSFYVGHILVGSPRRRLQVVFDTASGQVFFPSAKCRSSVCMERRRYSAQRSKTAVDINANGTPVQAGQRLAGHLANRDAITIGISSLDLGDGKVTGDLVRETICLDVKGNRQACAQVGAVAASELTEVPFQLMPHDGTVGLGLEGLSINPLFNFFGRYAAGAKAPFPQFGVFFGSKGGEITFGGHNPLRSASPLAWTPIVRREEGYWQVHIVSVRVGNHTMDVCRDGGCRGIIDTCASRIGVPSTVAPSLKALLATVPGAQQEGCQGPDLHFDLQGTVLTLRAEDYADGPSCAPQLAPLQLPQEFAGAFVFGEPVLRRYYTVFDLAASRIGFGVAAEAAEDEFDELVEAEQDTDEDPVDDAEPEAIWEAHNLTMFLLQALAMQIVVVLLLSFTGTYVKSMQFAAAHINRFLACIGLIPESSRIIFSVPPNEAPEADECVICLGSCEDDCKGKPRWVKLRCGHHFHEQCIFEWLWKVQRCPVCRCHMSDTCSVQWSRPVA